VPIGPLHALGDCLQTHPDEASEDGERGLTSHPRPACLQSGGTLFTATLALLSVAACVLGLLVGPAKRLVGHGLGRSIPARSAPNTRERSLLDGSAPPQSNTQAVARLRCLVAWLASAAESLDVVSALAEEPSAVAQQVPTSWPVFGTVTSPFGWRASPYGRRREYHPGIDIAAPYGTPVTASGDGEVVFAARDAGYGRTVIVDHGGVAETRYAHLSAIYVEAGERVRRGQVLGALGQSGRATGPHLHYEVRIAEEPVDPAYFLPYEGDWSLTPVTRSTNRCPAVPSQAPGWNS
jgi:murein DD-endopeptidase MepM/ murein hydrolase activator NlpD